MKKSYHSREVPIRLATMTRRTDDWGGVVSAVGVCVDIEALLGGCAAVRVRETVPIVQQSDKRQCQ